MSSISDFFKETRKYRIFTLAVPDLIGTILIVLIIAWLSSLSLFKTILLFIAVMVLASYTHYKFDVDTQLNYYLGLSKKPIL
jgi:uncharacterized membrane protein